MKENQRTKDQRAQLLTALNQLANQLEAKREASHQRYLARIEGK